jgi:hypothetical protein
MFPLIRWIIHKTILIRDVTEVRSWRYMGEPTEIQPVLGYFVSSSYLENIKQHPSHAN